MAVVAALYVRIALSARSNADLVILPVEYFAIAWASSLRYAWLSVTLATSPALQALPHAVAELFATVV